MAGEPIEWGNCLIKGFLRWRRQGYRGALVFTKSPNLGFRTHVTEEIPRGMTSFVPVSPKRWPFSCLHKICFPGYWRERR